MSRTYYRTKEAWAKARAKELKSTIHELRYTPSAGNGHARRRKFDQLRNLERELAKFERLADRYALSGQ